MTTSYITHDEAMINNPEYADFYISEIMKDGDDYEIQRAQYWYDEAKARKLQNVAMA